MTRKRCFHSLKWCLVLLPDSFRRRNILFKEGFMAILSRCLPMGVYGKQEPEGSESEKVQAAVRQLFEEQEIDRSLL